jgi:hypothetical protein
MKLFVIGANGKTGREILDLAGTRGHEVTAFVRSPDKLRLAIAHRAGAARSLTIVSGDPRRPESIAAALPGHDAVLSAIGPHPQDALRPSTLLADCAGATVEAMTARGVGRLAIVSAALLFPEKGLYCLSVADQAPHTRPARDGGYRAGKRPCVDDCTAASPYAIGGCELPRVARCAAGGKPRDVVPIGRGIHAGRDRAAIAYRRDRRTGERSGGCVVSVVLMKISPF